MAHHEEEELQGKAKLGYEAFLKYHTGRQMMREGKLELESLFGMHAKKMLKKAPPSELSPGKKSALTKKKKKLIAHRESSFKKDTRSDEVIKEKMLDLVRKNRQCSTALFMKKLKLSERRTQRCLGQLVGEGKLEDRSNGREDAARKWMFPEVKERSWKKEKGINGHKLSKTPGGGGKRNGFKTVEGSHGEIDVTDEAIVAKAKKFLETNDWVNKGKLLEAIDLSPGPGNRLIEHMKKNKIVKEVHKKNNPAHDKPGVRKFFVRHMPYLELA